jgi:putative ABC transport system permease protein
MIWLTHEYGKTIEWEIAQGRDFSRDFATDTATFIINETAVKYFGIENPIGKSIHWNGKNYKVIGVVKDILRESSLSSVQPTLYLINYDETYSWLTLKLNPDKSTSESLALVEDIFNEYLPAVPFDYQFIDQIYAKKFEQEERIGKISGVFAFLAVFISCLGLFGLASFMAEQRTKEVGIRKVLGASILNLWTMLSKDFVLLVILSCFMATTIAYYSLSTWLQNIDYRIELPWWIFASASVGALVIALLTVSFQAIKAEIANPVDSLRNE